MKWEYKVDALPTEDHIEYVDALNILGDQGWELVVEMMCEGVDKSVCTFKRARVELGSLEDVYDN